MVFKDHKSVIIVILLFFLFRKSKACGCETDEVLDTSIDENGDTSDNCKCEPEVIILNEFTERAFEQDLDEVRNYYDNNVP